MIRLVILVFFVVIAMKTATQAQDCQSENRWRVSVAMLPGLAGQENTGDLIDFMRNVAKTAGTEMIHDTVPFARSMINVETDRADIHVPLLDDGNTSNLSEKLMYSDAVIFEVDFLIHVKSGSKLSKKELANGSIVVETDSAHVGFFPFDVQGSSCLECSMQKLLLDRIDAFVYAKPPTEEAIKAAGLAGRFERMLYKTYPVRAVLQRTACGEAINQKLTSAVPQARKVSTHTLFGIEQPSSPN